MNSTNMKWLSCSLLFNLNKNDLNTTQLFKIIWSVKYKKKNMFFKCAAFGV
jgi:hypothetical protein